ncbi:hypothetical protein SDC9_21809 [bioreactor metagenome]|uniref:Uncharacterized protein n=1 Tax=bioreactor metagenome TaxID=1076179 RepID=A0A644UAS5_9ZZZZ|nr:hypothetical protein [Lentimicrobium sp.]MEA5111548.1 hypothetical protein [Lentimicrobium sp.]
MKKKIVRSLTLLISLILVSVLLYLWNFRHFSLSDSQTDWGTFGDYLSGIFAVFNLGVVVLLTLHIAKLDEERSNKELVVQQKILTSNFRYDELNKFEEEMLKVRSITMDWKKETVRQIINDSIGTLHAFRTNRVLFPEFNIESFSNQFRAVENVLYQIGDNFEKGKYPDKILPYVLSMNTLKKMVLPRILWVINFA